MTSPMRDWTYVIYNCVVFSGFLLFSYSVYHAEKSYKANREALELTAAELEMHRIDMGKAANVLTKEQIDLRRSMNEMLQILNRLELLQKK